MEVSSGDSASKKHIRKTSERAAMPRRSTKGPLDDPRGPLSTQQPEAPPTPSTSQTSQTLSAHNSTTSLKSFSSLLRPEIFHPLPSIDIAPPFLTSSHAPSPTTSLPTLLLNGHFRPAAIHCAAALTSPTLSPTDHAQIFHLFYLRLLCLTLCNLTDLAAKESTALEDLNAAIYRDDLSGEHLVPWELRVLAVRLQGIGFGDARRGVMGYFELARDARAEIGKAVEALMTSNEEGENGNAKDETALRIWQARLRELGVRVASALVEMEDLDGAAAHLATLEEGQDESESDAAGLRMQKALLWLKIGNLNQASKCVARDEGENVGVVEALVLMARGGYEEAVAKWRELLGERENEGGDYNNAAIQQNLAVCLLYAGRIDEARVTLETLIERGDAFAAVTFNLATVYELCTDKSRALKMELAKKVADLDPKSLGGVGWEKRGIDLKL